METERQSEKRAGDKPRDPAPAWLDSPRRALFFVLALPALARAALRLRRERHRRLDELARRLCAVEPFRLSWLCNPRDLAACLDRLLGRGSCLPRSLLLLDLWSRCGLQPELCLGVVRAPDARHLHAWVTASGQRLEAATPHREVWRG